MPPKTARKSAGPGRRGGRTRGAAAKVAAAQPDPPVATAPEESVNPVKEEDPVEVKEEKAPVVVKKEEKMEKVEEKPVDDNGIDHAKSFI
ncbi:hypothetical protein HanOQP8_Chr01g0022751 [Helianthus annuus]|nr:hypothetical protein HanOQP8_Chr01g0022751 [Helianthus annuus]